MVNTQKRMRGMQVIAIMLAVVLAFAGMIFAVMSSNGASAQAEQANPGSVAVGDSWLFGDEVVVDDDFYVASCLGDPITVYSFAAEFSLMQEQDVAGVWKIATGLEYFGISATSAEEPIGVRVASGAGTEENPFVMEAVYAEPATPVLPIVAAAGSTLEGTDALYPNLVQGTARTVVVKYYMSLPSGHTASDKGVLAAYIIPSVTNGTTTINPDSIAANPAFTSLSVNAADYNSGDSTTVEIAGEVTIGDIVGAANDAVTNGSNYLFAATYVIPADATAGEYTFAFDNQGGLTGGSFAFPSANKYDLAETSGASFFVRTALSLPETIDSVFDGDTHVGLTDGANYTVTCTEQTNAANYTLTVSLTDTDIYTWNLGNGSYSTADQTLDWAITAKPVTLAFDQSAYSAEYGQYTESGVTTLVGDISGLTDILEADRAGMNVIWDVTAGEYNSAAIDVTHAGTGAAFLVSADTGVYTIAISYTENSNYAVTIESTASYTIDATDPTLYFSTPDADGTELRVYNANAVTIGTSDAEIIYAYVSDAGVVITPTWYEEDGGEYTALAGAPAAAGNYKVTVALAATRNYNAASADRTFSIGKATQTASLTVNDRYFNGLPADFGTDLVVVTNASTGASASIKSGYTALSGMLHADEYTVCVVIPGDDNFEAWESEEETFTISAIPVDFAITLQNETYKGAAFAGSDLTVTGVSFDSENALLAAYLTNVGSDLATLNTVSNFTFSLTPDGVVGAGTHNDAVGVEIETITFSNATMADFDFTGADADITIEKADTTITISKVAVDGDDAKSYNNVAVTYGYNDSANELTYVANLANASSVLFDDASKIVVKFYYNDNAGAKGALMDSTPILPGTYWIEVTNTESANCNANATGASRQFVIARAIVEVTLSYVYNDGTTDHVKYLSWDKDLEELSYVTEATVSEMYAGEAMPVAATLNYFRTTGFGYDLVPYSASAQTISATYTFDVGAGDLNGDKRVTVDDVITLRRLLARHVSVRNVTLITEAVAWADYTASDDALIFAPSCDIVADEVIDAADVAAALEAFATGYGYAIVSDVDISGKKIKAVEEQTVYTYEELVSYVEMGYPVKIADNTDISAATQDFAPALIGSVAIDLNGNKLTVKSFDLSTADTDVTLKVSNGIIYSVADITISAPNGNVKVSDVNGYTYEGHTVTLAAYTSSLHIEENVAFYVYRVEGYGADAAAFAASIVTDDAVDEISEANITNTDYLIGQKTTKENEKAALEEEKQALIDAGADEAEVNAKIDEINAKGAEITNLEVKKAPVSIPVDTHVVVEEGAKLVVEQITVVEANDQAVSTFSIDVKSADAEVVKVDISAVKSTEEVNQVTVNYYHVEEVALAGDTSKIEVVSAEDQTVSEITGVKNETELKAALAAKSPVIEIGADFTVSHAATGSYVLIIDYPVTINGNGLTINVTGMGFWIGANPTTVSEVNINNLTIKNASNSGRCISTRGGVGTLNLNNVNLVCTGSGNNQAITVGGDHTPYIGTELEAVNINIAHSNIEANRAGYGILLFNKANITMTDSSAACGYSIIYGREPNGSAGSHGTTVLIEDSTLTTNNSYTYESSSSFAMFVDQDRMDYTRLVGTSVTVRNSTMNITTTNTALQAIFTGAFNDSYEFDNCTINLVGDNALLTYSTASSRDSVLMEDIDEENNVARYYYQLSNAYVGDETELRNAIALGASKIIFAANITSTNGYLIENDLEIDLNGKTLTVETGANVNNRAFKVSGEGVGLTIYNGTIDALGGGTTSSNGYGCYGAFRMEVGTELIAHDLVLKNYRPWGLNVKLLGATAELTDVDIISAYGGGIEVTDNNGASGTVQGYAKMIDCSVTQSGYFDHCSSAVAVSGNSVLDVYSTTYSAENAIYVYSSGGTINVYGGTFTGVRNAIVVASDLNTYPDAACIVNVYAGEINGTFSHSGKACDEINIYGGTFDHDPSAYVPDGYAAFEMPSGDYLVMEDSSIAIGTFEALAQAIAAVNAGTLVDPVLYIANDIAFEQELEIQKSVTILGNGTVKFIGYNATGNYNDAFYINTTAEDQTVTIQGIVFDHFCYYSNVANKTKGTKAGTSIITYAGACHSGTTLNIIECEVIGTGRDMINASSSLGCAGTINITDCTFDATDRISGTLNMLSFYGKQAADLYVTIENCIFSEATEGDADWATTAIASFGNAVITVDGCIFEDCQVAIGIDNTFDRLYSSVTYPVYVNTICTLNDVTYVNCYYGYYEESIVASVADIPEGYELADETASALYGNKNAAYGNYYEYDYVEDGTQGVDAKYLVVSSKYIAA